MDTITIKSLSFHAKHGYYQSERENGNTFEVDVFADGNFRDAAGGDNLSKTFDYEKAEQVISNIMNGSSEMLIETLCSKIGHELFIMFDILSSLKVSVRKLHPPLKTASEYAEITMRWKR